MTYTEKNCLKVNNNIQQAAPAARNSAKKFISDFSGNQIKEALIPDQSLTDPLEELIATGEAVFEIIRYSTIELGMKNAFYQLEKQFEFYKKLVQG